MRQRIILSTGNQGKVKELEAMLASGRFEVLSKREVGLDSFEIEETGTSLQENAGQKVIALYQQLKKEGKWQEGDWIMADDTGLFVDALGGRPGIYTARFAGPQARPADNIKKMLAELQGVASPRLAHFETVLAVYSQGAIHYFSGRLDGEILTEKRGGHGFGYDPIFYLPEKGMTLAEMGEEEKNSLSHRGKAYQAWMQSLGEGGGK